MAKKKRKIIRRPTFTSRGRLRLQHLNKLPPRIKRINRRKASKFQRCPNYWHDHGDGRYSKVELRTVEQVWLEAHQDILDLTFERVEGCERFPRYQQGLWDGYVWVVQFKHKSDFSKIRAVFWSRFP